MNIVSNRDLFAFYITGLPDPMLLHPSEIVPIKSRADYNAVRYLRKFRNSKKRSVLDLNLPTHHVPISEVTIGDWLLLPKRQNLPPAELSSDQLYVAGFWLAEGHHLKESKKGTSTFGQPVGICFTNTDSSYLDRIQPILHNWFPKSASHIRAEKLKNPRHNTKYVLEFRSWDAAKYFYPMFGEYSGRKSIGDSLYERSVLLPLVCGFLDGDGCQFKSGKRIGRISLITTSKNLAYQLRQILIDESIWTTLQYRDHNKPKYNRSYWLTVPIAYAKFLMGATKVEWPQEGEHHNYALPAPEGFYARVKKITLANELNT